MIQSVFETAIVTTDNIKMVKMAITLSRLKISLLISS